MQPVDYAIVRNLQASLVMTVADGFHYDVSADAVRLDPNCYVDAIAGPNGPKPLIVIELLPDEERREYHGGGELQMTLPVAIHWIGESDPTREESTVQAWACGCADIERAIAKDISRGGMAQDTRIVGRSFYAKGTQVEAVIDVEMLVIRNYGEPDA